MILEFPLPEFEAIKRYIGSALAGRNNNHEAWAAALAVSAQGRSFSDVERDLKAARRSAALAARPLEDELIDLVGEASSKAQKIELAAALVMTGAFSQRRVQEMTGMHVRPYGLASSNSVDRRSAMKRNFLLGKGERLTSSVVVRPGPPNKEPPYTFEQAEPLSPMLAKTAAALNSIPEAACPDGQVVGAVAESGTSPKPPIPAISSRSSVWRRWEPSQTGEAGCEKQEQNARGNPDHGTVRPWRQGGVQRLGREPAQLVFRSPRRKRARRP